MAPGVYPGMSRTVVRVTTGDGVVGLGETPSPDDAALLAGELGASFAGRELHRAPRRDSGSAPALSVARVGRAIVTPNAAAAGVEMALWDIAAREAGVPSASSSARSCARRSPSPSTSRRGPAARSRRPRSRSTARAMVEEHGSPAFEGKVGVWPPEDDLETVRLVREAIGPDRLLRLDANMGWSLETAPGMLDGARAVRRSRTSRSRSRPSTELAELRKASSDPVLVAHARSRAASRARRPGRARRRRRRLRRHRRARSASSSAAPGSASASGSTAATSASRPRRNCT